MKRKNLCLTAVLLLVAGAALFLGSCIREAQPSAEDMAAGRARGSLRERFTVEDARIFFEELRPGLSIGKGSPTRGGALSLYEPYISWQDALYSQFSGYEFIEVPFKGTYFSITKQTEESVAMTMEDMDTVVKLMCGLDSYGEIYYYLAYLTPGEDYLAGRGISMEEVTTSDFDRGYSGAVRFLTIGGELLWGYVVEDGIPVRFISPGSGHPEQTPSTRSGGECDFELVIFRNCYGPGQYDEQGNKVPVGEQKCYITGIDIEMSCSGVIGGNGSDSIVPPEAQQPGIPTPTPVPQLSQKIFKTDNLNQAQRTELDDMLNRILADCMGKALLQSVEGTMNAGGGEMHFTYDSSAEMMGYFEGSSSSGKPVVDIKLKNLGHSWFMVHEIFHGLQYFAGYGVNDLNQEMQAYILQGMFAKKYMSDEDWWDLISTTPAGYEIREILKLLDNKANLLKGETGIVVLNELFDMGMKSLREVPQYREMGSTEGVGISNISIIQSLSAGC